MTQTSKPMPKRAALLFILIVAGLAVTALVVLYASFVQMMTLGWMVIVFGMIWVGNRLISKKLDARFPWLKYGIGRFVVQIIIIVVYSLSVINASYLLFKLLFTADPPTAEQLIVMNAYGALIIIPVSAIYFGVYFLRSWTKSQLEAERLEKESTKAQLQTLRNHLDPHFLFNNLNILSALIDKDAKQSQKYLDKFAEVYRVILQSDKEELVTLSQELEFIDAYLYLVKIRFAELLNVNIEVPSECNHLLLPPLTVQMLLENALKHNIITEDQDLNILISAHDQTLEIRNTLNKKPPPERPGSGLNNISLRYSYFTDRKVVVSEQDGYFVVKIPLIDIIDDENPDT